VIEITAMWWYTTTCKYGLKDIEYPDSNIPDATKKAYLEWLCERQVWSYEEKMMIFAVAVIAMLVPWAWMTNMHTKRAGKLAITLVVQMGICLVLGLQTRNLSPCAKQNTVCTSSTDEKTWKQYENWLSCFGVFVMLFYGTNRIIKYCKTLTLTKLITGLQHALSALPDFTCIEGPIGHIAFNHFPFFIFAGLYFVLVQQPWFMCMIHEISACGVFVFYHVRFFGYCTACFAISLFLLYLFAHDNYMKMWNKSEIFLVPVRAMVATGPAAGTGGVKATEDNVRVLPNIAQYDGPVDAAGKPTLAVKHRRLDTMTKIWLVHIKVNGNTATINDIKEAFQRSGSNIIYDDDGVKFFMAKEFERLKILEPKKKKK